jgi:Fe-S oxidoreductase
MNLDVREFMRRMAQGNFNGAYRVLMNGLLFPEIALFLCGAACTRRCAENIDIHELERACISLANKREPERYSVSKKPEKVAVVGAGMSGLACALHLASRGFDVTVYDRKGEIGGSLADAMDSDTYLPLLASRFAHAPYRFEAGKEVDADALAECNAVYVATGEGGNDFGLLPGWDSQSMATIRHGWFLGGGVTGATAFEALAQGRAAGYSMEKFLLFSENMGGVEEMFRQRVCLYEAKNSGARRDPGLDVFSPEGANAEAARCRRCDCTVCVDNCVFLQSLNMYPKMIESVVAAALNPDGLSEKQGSRMIFSCAACGRCGSVCPEGVSLAPLFLKAKKTLRDTGKFPPPLHAWHLDDMTDANGTNYLARLPKGFASAKYAFFPGCQATESGAGHVKSAYAYIAAIHPDTAIWLGCCGAPALWAGEEELFQQTLRKLEASWTALGNPVVVTMCPTCQRIFTEYLPQVEMISLYEFIGEYGMPETRRRREACVSVFDPCSSRGFPKMQEAVRKLAEEMGLCIEEPKKGKSDAMCCGVGGHTYLSNRPIALQMTKSASAMTDYPYITYCENCRNAFLSSGKKCRHILDDVFGEEPLSVPLHIGDLRQNRTALRMNLSGEPPADSVGKVAKTPELEISDRLLEKMDSLMISADEAQHAVFHCEETGQRLRSDDGKRFVGHCKIGYTTVWVEYSKLGRSGFVLENAYNHRLVIKEPK